MEDNYGRKAAAYLPTLRFKGMDNPVVQIIDEADGEIVYTLRIKGEEFNPKVFGRGTYTVIAGDPDREQMKSIEHIRTIDANDKKYLDMKF